VTRLTIENAVGRRTGKNTSSWNTDTQTRIRHFINRRYRKLMASPGMPHLFDDTTTCASVASQSRYAIPNIESILRMRETTNDQMLLPMSMAEYRAAAPDPSATAGLPTHWAFSGYEPVAKQPADASELFLKSTSASDTQVAYVELDITGDYPRVLSVTLTGVTAVSLAALVTSAVRVKKFYLASAAAGVVTLHEDSGVGTELARIGIGQTSQRYYVFYLHPQPSSVITYSADVMIPVTDLAQDTDEPRLLEKFHDLLELGATMDELGKTDDSRYIVIKREYDDLMRDFRYWLACQGTPSTAAGEFSRLGAWFPANP
jgi:hypothetical protein